MVATWRLNNEEWADYILESVTKGRLRFIPRDAKDIKIAKLSRLGGGISNLVYGSSFSYSHKCETVELPVVLKVYREDKDGCTRESESLGFLERNGFSVPHLYLRELDETIFGAPFIIMQKIEGDSLGERLKRSPRGERLNLISHFARTLVSLHGLGWKDSSFNVLRVPRDEYEYAKQQITLIKHFRDIWKLKLNFGWAIDWLISNASLYPCRKYSLLHGDMNLSNFFVTAEGKLVASDWENPEIGDPLKDVGLAYHNFRSVFGTWNVSEGQKIAEFFVQKYIENSKTEFDLSAIRYYIFLTAVFEMLFYSHNSEQAKNPIFVKQILGAKYTLAFPLVSIYFNSKVKSLMHFLQNMHRVTPN